MDVFPWDMNGSELAVQRVVNALDEVGFVIEDARGFFHIFAAGFFHVGDMSAELGEVGGNAESIGGGGGTSEAEGVGFEASEEIFGSLGVDGELLVACDFIN